MGKSKEPGPQKLPPGRMVYYVPEDAYVKGHGYRASVVVENEDGHYPTGSWPYDGKPGKSMPYFWGHDYDKACAMADKANEQLGISKEEAHKIVTSSMTASLRRSR